MVAAGGKRRAAGGAIETARRALLPARLRTALESTSHLASRVVDRLRARTQETVAPPDTLRVRLEALDARGTTVIYLLQSCIAQVDRLLGYRQVMQPRPAPSPLPAAGLRVVRGRRKPPSGRLNARRGIPMLLSLSLVSPVIVIAGVFAGLTVYEHYVRDFFPPELAAINTPSQGSRIYDRNGELLYEFVDEDTGLRLPIALNNVADAYLAATIATEDSSFYDNPGVNPRGLVRAAWENLMPFSGSKVLDGSGGSSITQQLVKNVYVPEDERGERSLDRKLKEAAYALELTRNYEKAQILEWYVNQISYGGLYYGVEAASEGYFGKPASELSLAQAALLAGIPQSPARYDPRSQPENALARRNEILDIIARQGEVKIGEDEYFSPTPQEIAAAKAEPLVVREQKYPIKAPHFVLNQVTPELEALVGREALQRDGLVITTSLDLEAQSRAQEALERWVKEFEDISGSRNGAVLVLDAPTGEILAYLGSRDYFREDIKGNVNNLTALNSPGSSFKPFVYLASFIKLGWAPSTLIDDSAVTYTEIDGSIFQPQNPIRNSYQGRITLRSALGNSLNIPAFKAALALGVDSVVEVARDAGFTTLDGFYGPAIAIGGVDLTALDLTYGYSVLANNGRMAGRESIFGHEDDERTMDPISILRIEDREGNVLYDVEEHRVAEQAVPAAPAYMVTSILSDPAAQCLTFGCGGVTIAGRTAGVKTGTSEPFDPDGPDAGKIGETWAFGYTPDYVVGVWAGNSDNTPIVNIYSTSISFQAMRDTLQALYEGERSPAFERPDDVVIRTICNPGSACVRELFLEGSPVINAPAPAALVLPTRRAEGSPTLLAAGNTQPLALITGSTGAVSGTVTLQGWAWSPRMTSYRLEYRSDGSWQPIGQGNRAVRNGSLGVWVTEGLSPGRYQLRVVVDDASIGSIVSPGLSLTVSP